MKRNEIKIQVVGLTASGKSTIIGIINGALIDNGFNTEIISDDDFKVLDRISPLPLRIKAIKEKNVKITIEEKQANRPIIPHGIE